MSYFQARTDLALEARESISEADGSLHGVIAEETEKNGMHITTVKITTKNGAKSMGKPMGSYVTIEAPAMTEPREDRQHYSIPSFLSLPFVDNYLQNP